ncbi:MAG TPA: hypothetical protein VL523_13145 [Terriglobia bacterium]|nr:hypothetical protein [Terriglobia bacterium]
MPPAAQPESPEMRQARLDQGRYKGLLRAIRVRKADRSEHYAPNFGHGLCATDLDRSAAAAGESRAELRRHLALFDRVLLTLGGFFAALTRAVRCRLPLRVDAASALPLKFVRAIARLAWYMLRLPRTQAVWEQRAVTFRLQELARWRQEHGPLTLARFNAFHEALDDILANQLGEFDKLYKLRRRLFKLWDLLLPDDSLDAEPSGSPESSQSSGETGDDPGAETGAEIGATIDAYPSALPRDDAQGDEAVRMATGGAAAAGGFAELGSPSPIAPRSGGTHYDQFHPNWTERLNELGPEEMANARQSPSHSRRALARAKSPAALPNPKDWRRRGRAGPKAGDRVVDGWARDPADRVLRRLVRHGELTVPETFPAFLELMQQALGNDPRAGGDCRIPNADCRSPESDSRKSKTENRNSERGGRKSKTENRNSKRAVSVRSGSEICNLKSPISRRPRPARSPSLHSAISKRQSAIVNHQPLPPDPNPRPGTIADQQSPPARGPIGNPSLRGDQSEIANPELLRLAEVLWARLHLFEARARGLAALLEATLKWDTASLARGWRALLSPNDAYDAAGLIGARVGPDLDRADARVSPGPAGPLQAALGYWFLGVMYASARAAQGSYEVTVMMWDLGVGRFGLWEELLEWRPKLSLNHRAEREGRPEWQLRVTTVQGKTLVKLPDGSIFEPESKKSG